MEWQCVELRNAGAKSKTRCRLTASHLCSNSKGVECNIQKHQLEVLEKPIEPSDEHEQMANFSMAIVPIRSLYVGIAEADDQKEEIDGTGWIHDKLDHWIENSQSACIGKGRKPNSAALAVMLRRAIAREKALVWGRKLHDPRTTALEQEAARWNERREEEGRIICKETVMLQRLIQSMERDEFFDEGRKGTEWSIGKVTCFADKMPPGGWELMVVAMGRSWITRRWGWNDLLGVYQAQLDSKLNLMSYVRVTEDEINQFLKDFEEHQACNQAPMHFTLGRYWGEREKRRSLAQYPTVIEGGHRVRNPGP